MKVHCIDFTDEFLSETNLLSQLWHAIIIIIIIIIIFVIFLCDFSMYADPGDTVCGS